MFEVGFSELLLIMALALIVLGPEKLPKVASQVGRWMGRARAMARQFRETLEEEVQLDQTPRRPASTTSGSSAAGAAASAPSADATTTGAAAAGGLAASAPDHDPAATSNIPYADVGEPVFTNDAADTRHNEYAGSAYVPPDTSLDPLTPPAESPAGDFVRSPYADPAITDAPAGFDANQDPTAPVADADGQRGA